MTFPKNALAAAALAAALMAACTASPALAQKMVVGSSVDYDVTAPSPAFDGVVIKRKPNAPPPTPATTSSTTAAEGVKVRFTGDYTDFVVRNRKLEPLNRPLGSAAGQCPAPQQASAGDRAGDLRALKAEIDALIDRRIAATASPAN